MRPLDAIRRRWAALLERSRMHAELEEELRSHLQLRADDLERSGLSRAEAERRARLEFGPYRHYREECREAAGGAFVETLGQDLRFTLRLLRKSPSFTAVAVATLALAVGANAVVFAALNAMVLRPLDLPRVESLHSIHRKTDNSGWLSIPNFRDFRERNRSFEDLASYTILVGVLETPGEAGRVWMIAASGNYFDALGIQPHLGRLFHGADERGPDSAPYVVLSHAFWRGRFRSDRGVIGRVVKVNTHPYTVIGVAPPGFQGTLLFAQPDLFVPWVNQAQLEGTSVQESRATRWLLQTVGHLKDGVTPEQAASDLDAIGAALEKAHPREYRHVPFKLARPSLYGDYMGGPVKAFLTALMLLSALILLAACANLGSLFAARAADRSREIALRLSLGASRGRILRQLFTEAMLIAALGCAFGIAGSAAFLRWLSAWQPFPQFPFNLAIHPDAKVYGVAALLSVVSGLLFGAAPVRQVLRTDPYEVVKSGESDAHRRRITVRDVLVAVQIAVCAVLVTSSMVAVRGLLRSMHADLGFQPRHAMLLETSLDTAGYRGDAVPPMQKRLLEAMEALPGVTAAGLVDLAPLMNGTGKSAPVFLEETADLLQANAAATPIMLRISPDYLRAAGTSLLSGRGFTWHDGAEAPRVALVNQELARRLFGGTGINGRRFKMQDGSLVEVVGVVEDGKYLSLTEAPRPAMFVPILQWPSSEMWMVVRSESDPVQLAAAMRSRVRDLDSGLFCDIHTWTSAMSFPLFPSRVAAVALGLLGVMGAMLSMTGIFGMAAYSVSRRLKELGIRMALGAQRGDVLRAALGRALKVLGLGSAAGLVLGLLASRVLASIVYQATPRDPLVLAGVVLAMLSLGLVATWIPAQRALSVRPLILLREQ